ncbi:two-component sensor histidine kinase [Arenicella chitinivorans]|uniref:histidine kinase n=1 Tax=Arenicella chitinivorans TaxID=1329800 RepID=A0A918RVX8_9GAMM|nr:HAMP domain-containing sensor histidine kinase [Arenicella chitinivorans]GHA12014.1 two-component sensor histidine kinase [Arenicella chitinivorans]
MKRRFPILLILFVCLPLAALMCLGGRLYQQERVVRAHQAQSLADARLLEAQGVIDDYFKQLQQESYASLQFLDLSVGLDAAKIALIRALVQSDPMLDQVFILRANGDRLFPPQTNQASLSEREFIQQTQRLWQDPSLFYAKFKESEEVSANHNQRQRYSRAAELADVLDEFANRDEAGMPSKASVPAAIAKQKVQEQGWTTWDIGTETQTFYWFRDAREHLIGQKLSNAFWLSELINVLPDRREALRLGRARVKLFDRQQNVVYQWGQYEVPNDQEAISQRLLPYPLDGWRLAYYAPSTGFTSALQSLVFYATLLVLGMAVAVIGFYLLRELRRDIRQAEQRVTFVNQVSHELKTPLTNICMYTEMLDSELSDDAQPDRDRLQKFSGVVRAESQRLARLINNVLSFSRARQHPITVRPAPHSLDDIVRATATLFKPALSAKGIELTMELNAPVKVMVDAAVVEQVLNNLLSNVEKYAAEGKLARIRTVYASGVSQIEVIDAGRGIDVEQKERIFEPFERGGSRLTEGVSGTGIGLSISRDLARAHGGDLTLSSASSGAHFILRLSTPQAEAG